MFISNPIVWTIENALAARDFEIFFSYISCYVSAG